MMHTEGDLKDYLWVCYRNMLRRCLGTYGCSQSDWENYGGRGIGVCARWLNSFHAFVSDVGERPGKGFSLDRINNAGDYEPGNVRWSTRKEQGNNTRRNVKLTHAGETLTRAQWIEKAPEYGLTCNALRERLRDGWPLEQALTQPMQTMSREQRSDARRRSWITRRLAVAA